MNGKLFLVLGLFLISSALMARDFSGRYVLQTGNGEVVLSLTKNGDHQYGGEFSGNGNVFAVRGRAQNGQLAGEIGAPEDLIRFEAALENGVLHLAMYEVDGVGQPQLHTVQRFVFQPAGTAPPAAVPQDAASGAVIINDLTLNADQIAGITKTYRVTPKPGRYWYDSNSGLYGVVGYQAFGFMLPGHDFGTLTRSASNGNTGVVVNKRELPQGEWLIWSYILGSWIQPGSYWLDAQGNAGYEGSPYPLVNLYAAAQQNAYNGRGGSGDNFWSTRFSAGNSDQGNTRGYVSVPGYGPVGYGF